MQTFRQLLENAWLRIGAAWLAILSIMPILKTYGLIESIANEGHLSTAYLWTSLGGTVVLAMGLVWETNRAHAARLSLNTCESARDIEIGNERGIHAAAARLTHRCSELVREFVTNRNDWGSQKANYVLGDLLVDFLRLVTKSPKELTFRVTVKRIVAGADGQDRVKVLFRCKNQAGVRAFRDEVAWDDSVVMRTFDEDYDPHKSEQRQSVHIEDLKAYPGVPASYREGLTKLDVASILGFPLRGHATSISDGRISKLLGFLSIDCSEPHVFDKLFKDPAVTERQALDVCFAVADALATVLVIESRVSKQTAEASGKTQ